MMRRLISARLVLPALAAALLWPALAMAEAIREFKEVDKISTPVYRARSSTAWQTHCRLIGQIFNAPEEFSISYFNLGRNQEYRTETYNGRLSVYESGWIFPGKYKVTIKAKGFDDFVIKSLELKQGYDCVIDVTFGKRVFRSPAR